MAYQTKSHILFRVQKYIFFSYLKNLFSKKAQIFLIYFLKIHVFNRLERQKKLKKIFILTPFFRFILRRRAENLCFYPNLEHRLARRQPNKNTE